MLALILKTGENNKQYVVFFSADGYGLIGDGTKVMPIVRNDQSVSCD